MIRFHPTRSGMLLSIGFALSLLLYQVGVFVPIRLSDWYGGVFYLAAGLFLAAMIDHGQSGASAKLRWRRFGISVLAVFAWFVVGAGIVSLYSGASLSFGKTATEAWSTLWPMAALAIVMSLLGMALARWLERRAVRFDAQLKKA